MTRAIDRLIVSGAIDLERAQDRDTPIGWVLERLDARERGRARAGRAGRARARRGAVRPHRRSLRASERRSPRSAGRGRGRAARAVRRSCRRRPPPRGYRLPELVAAGRRAAAPRSPALVLRARAVRALLVSLLRGAGGRAARGARDGVGAGGLEGDRGRRRRPPAARARRPRGARARRTSSPCAAWYPAVTDEELERIRGFVAAYCDSELARADRDARRRSARAAVRVRARRRAPARPARRALARGQPGARPRLQDELAGRGRRPRRSSRPTTACSGSSTRSRASAPAPRRSRSSTTSSSGPTRSSRRTFERLELPLLEAELSAAIARINAGEFVPTPSEFNCAGCPALDLVCAGPRLGGGAWPPQEPVAAHA